MRLSKLEQETIILFNEEEKTAECYTCNKRIMSRLDKLVQDGREITLTKQDEYSKTYVFPKKWVKINPTRILSEESKEKMRTKLEKARNARKLYSTQ